LKITIIWWRLIHNNKNNQLYLKKSAPCYTKNHDFIAMKKWLQHCFLPNWLTTKITSYFNKRHKQLQQKYFVFAPIKNNYIFATIYNVIEKYEHRTCSKPLQYHESAFQTKLVRSCYILKKHIHDGPDLGKNIITIRMCFQHKLKYIYNIE
jgi:hypothetical protein